MFVEAGHFALILALFVAVAQAIVPLAGATRGNAAWMAFAKPAAIAQFLLLLFSFAALTQAYIVSDFSVLNVVINSHSAKPMIYKITGVWANHEGSMLLWVLVLAGFGMAMAVFGRNLPPSLRARALGIQALVSVGFLLFIIFTSNPFERMLPPPADGRGMNPLLQDLGLALHPPFLYLGYVGFSVAFSFSIAALIEGRVDAAWARWVRPWTMVAWVFLTAGISLGSWWAYYELGWGGFWFWDPVENASFMPWLVGTALLHSAIVVEKRDSMRAWTVFLAIITFALSLLGTFMVRSGVLNSVHAFASDPKRGVFILVLLLLVTGGSLALFAWRGPTLKSPILFRPVSREGGLLLNNLLMSIGAAVVLLGSLYPLFLDAVGGGKVSVGSPFFNAVFLPLMVPMILAMAFGPMLNWKRGDLIGAAQRLRVAFVAMVLAAGTAWVLVTDGPVWGLIGSGLAAWLFVGTLVEIFERARKFKGGLVAGLQRLARMPRANWGMTLGHLGLAIVIMGITAAGAWKQESIQVMKPGQTVTLSGYDFKFEGAREGNGPNYFYTQGTFKVSRDGKPIVTLEPEKRTYPVRGTPTTEAAIYPLFTGDLYAVIADPEKDAKGKATGGYVTRIYFNPLVSWMWAGYLIMVLGGGISLSDRRYRIGAPVRKSKAAPVNAPAKEA